MNTRKFTPNPAKGEKLSYQQAAVLAYRVLILAIDTLDRCHITDAEEIEPQEWQSTIAVHNYELTLGYFDTIGEIGSPIPSCISNIYDVQNGQDYDVTIYLKDAISKYHRALIASHSGIVCISAETFEKAKQEYFNPDASIKPQS